MKGVYALLQGITFSEAPNDKVDMKKFSAEIWFSPCFNLSA